MQVSFRKQTQQIVFEILHSAGAVAICQKNKYFTNYLLFITRT